MFSSLQKRDKGQVLFDKVCEQLNLLERDYYGISYRDIENQKVKPDDHLSHQEFFNYLQKIRTTQRL